VAGNARALALLSFHPHTTTGAGRRLLQRTAENFRILGSSCNRAAAGVLPPSRKGVDIPHLDSEKWYAHDM
jgi:hypothetical protein